MKKIIPIGATVKIRDRLSGHYGECGKVISYDRTYYVVRLLDNGNKKILIERKDIEVCFIKERK